ncbi:MAG TPA: DMT family transporter [Steroidobacteraceae bacterium]|nr:DMT family transporter [Steroidobacteraceae bacterium]
MSWRSWLAFGALGVIWGVPYFFIKLAVLEVSPFVVAWGRITLAALVLLPIAWHRGALRPLGAHKGTVLAFACAEFVVPFSVISIGERWIDSSVTGILIAAVPLTITLISRFFGVHERLGFARLTGLGLGLLGVVALVGLGSISGVLGWMGVGCMLLATLGYAIGPLIIQRHLSGLDSIGPIAASLLISSAVLLIPALLTFPRHMPSAVAIWSIVVLGLACTALAMLLMFYLVSHAGASRASIITYINPAVATLLGVFILHEHLGVGGALAFGMILLGSWLATRGGAGHAEAGAPASA